MKRRLLLTLSVLCLVFCMLFLAACSEPSGPSNEDDWTPTGESVTLAVENGSTVFYLIYGTPYEVAESSAAELSARLEALNLFCGVHTYYSVRSYDNEILVGETDREASARAKALVDEKLASSSSIAYAWAFYYYDGKLAIYAPDAASYKFAIEDLLDRFYSDGKLAVGDDLREVKSLTDEEYNDKLIEMELAAAEERKKENAKLLSDLLGKIEDQREYISEEKPFGVYTENIGTSTWKAPPTTPINDHPRLLVTKDSLAQIRDSVAAVNDSNNNFKQRYQAVIANDAVLPEAVHQGNNATIGGTDIASANIHNYDPGILESIVAKALAYLLYDDEYYGYEAIYYMKNYLLSLDIQRIASDMCRQYGHVMFASALVYDWCYDLLTEEDKAQFIAGIEDRTAAGYCGLPDSFSSLSAAKKMEVGFPPSGQGSVSGHGSEYQILRDYLSASIAIYDENPSWWNYVAARVYDDYVDTRNYYFQSGISQQGTGYATTRHMADLYSAWILTVATGKNPYEGMDKTVRSFLGYEFDGAGSMFNDGDGTGDYRSMSDFSSLAYMTAYLYADKGMLAQANFVFEGRAFNSGYSGLSCTTFVALHGLSNIKPAEDRHEGMDLIQYNGYPLGQYVVHQSWGSDAASIVMRIKERTTANHEHGDAGTFEIYYKGMLTSDGGAYNNYGHEHTQYFHQTTIAHNGLIIFDASKWNPSGGASSKWYSGSQRKLSETSALDSWLNSSAYDTGTVVGRQHAYSDKAETQPLYAYIAGDITEAYDTNQAIYVGRSMLTVYTGDEDYPMVFFVYDNIVSAKSSFEKRFLLQISSFKEPTIDEKEQTVITENGDGRLVLTCLSDNVKINAYGGRVRTDNKFDAVNSKNYQINGVQLAPMNGVADDGHWGRVEIVSTPKTATTAAEFMNVIYVTDKGNKKMPNVSDISAANGVEGGVFDKSIVAVFATSEERATTELSFKTSAASSMSYYVAGVKEGKWKVTVDGKSIGTFEATKEGGLLTFTAPGGSVVVTPAK